MDSQTVRAECGLLMKLQFTLAMAPRRILGARQRG
jgi:hypothetical protein